ncbi:MAG: hypothetical protein LW698_05320 [Planctomycetaceae bacterium]|nr:hypothetical protein [Planctomycetaceae bacterium]
MGRPRAPLRLGFVAGLGELVGTSVTGAKFTIPSTPAATSRSAASWARAAGTTIIPRRMPLAFTVAASSSTGWMRMPWIVCPTFVGSASKAAAMAKFWWPKPR